MDKKDAPILRWVKTSERNPTKEGNYCVTRHMGTSKAVHFWYQDEQRWSSQTDEWLEEVGVDHKPDNIKQLEEAILIHDRNEDAGVPEFTMTELKTAMRYASSFLASEASINKYINNLCTSKKS